MSNSRRLRRRLKVNLEARGKRFPERPPSLGTVRRWIKQGEAAGLVERTGEVQRTGKPGRPAHLWQLTAEGKEHVQSKGDSVKDALTVLQAQRARALMHRGMTEQQAIAAVTKGWKKPAQRPARDKTGSLDSPKTHPDRHGR